MLSRNKSGVLTVAVVITLFVFQVGLSHGAVESSASASLNVAVLKLANITYFSITPASVYQLQYLDFAVGVKNTGSVETGAVPFINITSGNTSIANITFLPMNISPGNTVEFASQLQANFAPGSYTAKATVYYDGNQTEELEKNFTILVSPPLAGGEGGGEPIFAFPPVATPSPEVLPSPEIKELPLPEIVPIEEKEIEFTRMPVLLEVRPGLSTVASVALNPLSQKTLDADVELSGLPKEWGSVAPRKISISPEASGIANVALSAPLTALPGDYKISIKLKAGELAEENFFILRIKPYPPNYEKPSVLRKVYIDKKKQTARVVITIENSGAKLNNVELVEEVPKSIAEKANSLVFETPASEVMREDPLLRWSVGKLEPYETVTISYEVPHILKEYSPYVYWPMKQLNVLYLAEKPIEFVRISEVSASPIPLGKAGNAYLSVINLYSAALNITITPDAPFGWSMKPERISEILPQGSAKNFAFSVSPPPDASPGTYTLSFHVSAEGGTKTKTGAIMIQSPQTAGAPIELGRIIKTAALAFLGILLIAFSREAYKRRKRKTLYREETVSEIKEIRKALKEK